MKKYEETKKLFDDVIALKAPERVPIMANLWCFALIWQKKYKLSEMLYNNDKFFEAYCETLGSTGHDAFFNTAFRNPLTIYDTLGIKGQYIVDDEKSFLNHHEQPMIEASEYDALLADPQKFVYETFFPRRMTAIQNKAQAKDVLRNGMLGFLGMVELTNKINAKLAEDHGMLSILNSMAFPPMEMVIDTLRGLKGTLLDMRRCPEKLEAVIAAMMPFQEVNFFALHPAAPPPAYPTVVDFLIPLIGTSMLGRKQFERLCWPHIKTMCERVFAAGKTMEIFCEGHTESFYDLWLQLPKGKLVLQFEYNDLREARKVFAGHSTICGGIPSTLLATGTVEECVDCTKKLLDDVAPGGGFIFSQSKMMSYVEDGTLEKVCACNQVVREYGRYH